jgi:hypothetical protein
MKGVFHWSFTPYELLLNAVTRGPESSSDNVINQPFILWPRPSNGASHQRLNARLIGRVHQIANLKACTSALRMLRGRHISR